MAAASAGITPTVTTTASGQHLVNWPAGWEGWIAGYEVHSGATATGTFTKAAETAYPTLPAVGARPTPPTAPNGQPSVPPLRGIAPQLDGEYQGIRGVERLAQPVVVAGVTRYWRFKWYLALADGVTTANARTAVSSFYADSRGWPVKAGIDAVETTNPTEALCRIYFQSTRGSTIPAGVDGTTIYVTDTSVAPGRAWFECRILVSRMTTATEMESVAANHEWIAHPVLRFNDMYVVPRDATYSGVMKGDVAWPTDDEVYWAKKFMRAEMANPDLTLAVEPGFALGAQFYDYLIPDTPVTQVQVAAIGPWYKVRAKKHDGTFAPFGVPVQATTGGGGTGTVAVYTTQAPKHTWNTAGTKTVKLTVTDSQARTATLTKTVTVVAGSTPAPVTPTGLQATVSGTSVVLTWTATTDVSVTAVNVYRVRNPPPGETGTALDPVLLTTSPLAANATTYTDTPAERGVIFTYFLRNKAGTIESAPSADVDAVIPVTTVPNLSTANLTFTTDPEPGVDTSRTIGAPGVSITGGNLVRTQNTTTRFSQVYSFPFQGTARGAVFGLPSSFVKVSTGTMEITDSCLIEIDPNTVVILQRYINNIVSPVQDLLRWRVRTLQADGTSADTAMQTITTPLVGGQTAGGTSTVAAVRIVIQADGQTVEAHYSTDYVAGNEDTATFIRVGTTRTLNAPLTAGQSYRASVASNMTLGTGTPTAALTSIIKGTTVITPGTTPGGNTNLGDPTGLAFVATPTLNANPALVDFSVKHTTEAAGDLAQTGFGYVYYREDQQTGALIQIGTKTGTAPTQGAPKALQIPWDEVATSVFVRAVATARSSGLSNELLVVSPAIVSTPSSLTAPTGFTLTPGDSQILATWNLNPVAEQVTAYRLYIKWGANAYGAPVFEGPGDVVDASRRSHLITNLENGTPYTVRITPIRET